MEIKREILDNTVLPSGVAFLAYAVRVIVRRRGITLLNFVLDSISSIFVGLVVGNMITIYDLPIQAHIAIISLCGMIGPDLLAGLLVITTMFKESPNSLILKYISAIRGGSGEKEETEIEINEVKETAPIHFTEEKK